MSVILASQSPRRKELLYQLIENFKIVPANIDETIGKTGDPKAYVSAMAENKAKEVAKKYPNDLVIGCDTIVYHQGKILGKPLSRKEAYQMLENMSGQTHTVYTAVAMRKEDKICSRLVSCSVTFFDLLEEEIQRYLDKKEYADKAGAYGIQGAASVFVKKVCGDYYSVVGFPIGVVAQMMKEFSKSKETS
ncbi:MAG TPA: septum formation protein Maf [Candidatus Tetragenococcus pullicola]|nr:septum formation protein Maf [Candidatus Tetragenococcus pullicola]